MRRADVSLRRLQAHELQDLAEGRIPHALLGRVEADALPPAFVAQRALDQLRAGVDPGWCATFLMLREADGQVLGSCGFKHAPDADGLVEIGYGVAPGCQRQGVASQAVQALCAIALRSTDVRQVLACISPSNQASMALARKLGFEAGLTLLDAEGEHVVAWTLVRQSRSAGIGSGPAEPPASGAAAGG
jgi:RimJ/RimL family protein N-acetyltransferase